MRKPVKKEPRWKGRWRKSPGTGDLRLLGPNCFGVINTHLGLNASLGLGLPEKGGVSLITPERRVRHGRVHPFKNSAIIGFAKVIAPGNKIDIDEIELLAYLRNDPETRVIAMLIESISNGRALFEEIDRTTDDKPVVILKNRQDEFRATRRGQPYRCPGR